MSQRPKRDQRALFEPGPPFRPIIADATVPTAPALSSAVQHVLEVPGALAGRRLDQALAQMLSQHSRNRLKGWIETGFVNVDGVIVTTPRFKLHGGETVIVEETIDPHETASLPQPIALSILHEDAAILVIDKPVGLVMHPGSGNRDGTLQNALLHHAPELAHLPRAGIVHRLDKETSGLVVVARTPEAQTDLVRQLSARTVKREYAAVVYGSLARATTIDAPIGRHPTHRTSMAVVAKGKPARTHVDIVERFDGATLVRCRLETGRTHQIRVHLTALGHPLLGDPTYRTGRKTADLLPAFAVAFPRQALHAQRLGLMHPMTREPAQWESPLPADLCELLVALRAHASPAAR